MFELREDLKFAAVCCDGVPIVVPTLELINNFVGLSNGFVFTSNTLNLFSPYLFQSNDYSACCLFDKNVRANLFKESGGDIEYNI